MSDALKLAEMLCTRFCHDIIGPVGAVNNGAEFLREEMKDSPSQAADLIESSAKEAVARVQFYRQAYGMGSTGSNASLTEMRELAANYFAAGKIRLQWSDKTAESQVPISHAQKKLVLNLLILASAALIRGGKITIDITETPAFIITATGEKAVLQENYERALKGTIPEAEIDPRLIQASYTNMLAKQLKTTVDLKTSAEGIVFSFNL